MSYLLIRGDARRIPLADGSVHCVVTSPPYFGLRDYGVRGQIGLEDTPDAYVTSLVDVFREVWRVLRDDGVVWLNLGDSYSSSPSNQNGRSREGFHGGNAERWVSQGRRCRSDCGLAPKQLLGIPWRVAFALQADGWYLRADCVWSKPNPMPESVRDRPTKSHEYVFLLAKSERYYYDADAVREPSVDPESHKGILKRHSKAILQHDPGFDGHRTRIGFLNLDGQVYPRCNRRSVWTITTQPLKAAHFATMPPKLAALCIKAGTSRKGCCPRCGAPWRRRVRKSRVATRPGTDSKVNRASQHADSPYEGHSGMIVGNRDPKRHTTVSRTVGWESTCTCLEPRPVPCVVLDPFGGAGTTPLVATALGRHGIALDLKPEYLALARRRIERPHARHVGTVAGADLPLFAHLEDP